MLKCRKGEENKGKNWIQKQKKHRNDSKLRAGEEKKRHRRHGVRR